MTFHINIFLILFTCFVISQPQTVIANQKTSTKYSFYFGLNYYRDFAASVSDIIAPTNNIKDMLGFDLEGKATQYAPKYTSDFLSAGTLFGIEYNNITTDIELQFNHIIIDSSEFTNKMQAHYFEFQKSDNLTGALEDTSGAIPIKSNILINKRAYSIQSTTAPNTGIMPTIGSLTSTDYLALKFTNTGFDTASLLVNTSINLLDSHNDIVPFLSCGIGIAKDTFLNTTTYGISYQLKSGLRQNISDNFSLSIGLYYRGTFKNDYKVKSGTPINYVGASNNLTPALSPTDEILNSNSIDLEISHSTYGVILGVIIRI